MPTLCTDLDSSYTEHYKSLAELAQSFPNSGICVDPAGATLQSRGLTPNEAELRLAADGPNLLTPPKRPSVLVMLFKQFLDPFLILLLLAAILALATYAVDGTNTNIYVAVALALVILITALTSFHQERKTSQVLSLYSSLLPPSCLAIRDGIECPVPATSLVTGDVVRVNGGDRIPADLRIIYSQNAKIELSTLTGESEPVACSAVPDDASNKVNAVNSRCLAFNGSHCVEGSLLGIVIRTGDHTYIGNIARLSSGDKKETLMQTELKRFVKFIAILAIGMACAAFSIGTARTKGTDVVGMFIYGFLVVIVANVPQGLPATVTSLLTITASRMASRNILVKRLDSIETLGSASLIATDKTGTLTQNKMTVTDVWIDGRVYSEEFSNLLHFPLTVEQDQAEQQQDLAAQRRRHQYKQQQHQQQHQQGLSSPAPHFRETALNATEFGASDDTNDSSSSSNNNNNITMSNNNNNINNNNNNNNTDNDNDDDNDNDNNNGDTTAASAHTGAASSGITRHDHTTSTQLQMMTFETLHVIASVCNKACVKQVLPHKGTARGNNNDNGDDDDDDDDDEDENVFDDPEDQRARSKSAAAQMRTELWGNASDVALYQFSNDIRSVLMTRSTFPSVFEIPFNSTNKWQLTIVRSRAHSSDHDNTKYLLLMKGAPEIVLGKCKSYLRCGMETPIDQAFDTRFQETYAKFAARGCRVLGFACKSFAADSAAQFSEADQASFPRDGLVFVGMVAIMDPPRSDVKSATKTCHEAGIKVFMVTGDHPLTAKAIAEDVGILNPDLHSPSLQGKRVVLGADIDSLSERDWRDILSQDSGVVFARTTPQHKLKIVLACQALNQVVAVTGDGK